jgi:uncharacterized membrane protein
MDGPRRPATQHPTRRWRLWPPRRVGSFPALPAPHRMPTARGALPRHPVVLRLDADRSADLQLRLADRITAFAGSMPFVYLHAVAFGAWMLFFEKGPWPTLTLVVSLEAIFLSTFVMIGQNRQAAFQQAKADHDFLEEEQELKTNTELTRAIHRLTSDLHQAVLGATSIPQVESMDSAERTRPAARSADLPAGD